ncbi:MAG: hypothetical protein AAGI38_24595 [Bacteroidota bacterium]
MKSSVISAYLMVLILGLTSCRFVVETIYGVKSHTKYRSEEKLRDFSVDIGLDTTHLLTIDYPVYQKVLTQLPSYPDVMIFDSSGLYLSGNSYDSSTCPGAVDDLLAMIGNPQFPQPEPSTEFTLNKQLHLLRTLNGDTLESGSLGQSDYYVFIFTAYFLGPRINKDNALQWHNQLEKREDKKFFYATVFIDQPRWWEEQYDE